MVRVDWVNKGKLALAKPVPNRADLWFADPIKESIQPKGKDVKVGSGSYGGEEYMNIEGTLHYQLQRVRGNQITSS
jgi:hypothetical protein